MSAGEPTAAGPGLPDGPGPSPLSRALRVALAPLVRRPDTAAVVADFDGTLAPIVDDPVSARPLEGTVDVLGRLSRTFRATAVVSGRPVQFLLDVMGLAPAGQPGQPGQPGRPGGMRGVRDTAPDHLVLVGSYGLEWWEAGETVLEQGAERWRRAVGRAADQLASRAPAGVHVERKPLAVTVHWRNAPDRAEWVAAAVARAADEHGLETGPARLSLELRPPIAVDKGTVVRRLVEGCTSACYLGDDIGDLPAFAALQELSAERGLRATAVAVVDDESAGQVAAAADLVVAGPRAALGVLTWLADEAGARGEGTDVPGGGADGPDGRS